MPAELESEAAAGLRAQMSGLGREDEPVVAGSTDCLMLPEPLRKRGKSDWKLEAFVQQLLLPGAKSYILCTYRLYTFECQVGPHNRSMCEAMRQEVRSR
jgi:hypothetical protein